MVCAAVATLTVLGFLDDPNKNAEGDPSTSQAAAESKHQETLPFPLGLTDMERHGYLLFRRMKCLRCHTYHKDGVTYSIPDPLIDPKKREDFPFLEDLETETIEDVAGVLEEGSGEDMPAFPNLSAQDRLAVGAFVRYIIKDAEKDR